MSSKVRIGISGWRYAPWRGDFYPRGLAQKDELAFASRAVGSIEINGSFYALQTPERYAGWAAQVPEGFVFSVKAPRFITHVRRLRDIHEPLANFLASGLFQLRHKLGPILWQFPPSFKFDPALFEQFLQQLPHHGRTARQLARQCSERLQRDDYLDIPADAPLRHCVEIRHASFIDPAFVELLQRHNIALVVADTAGKWPWIEELCGDFVYLRLHGDQQLYSSGYGDQALERWGQRIELWRQGRQPADARRIPGAPGPERGQGGARDVYCYFDNDIKVRAPYDARQLMERLGLADTLTVQPGLAPQGDWK
ncbi:DUF72 domain-containing protein [Pseudomonas piscis]